MFGRYSPRMTYLDHGYSWDYNTFEIWSYPNYRDNLLSAEERLAIIIGKKIVLYNAYYCPKIYK